MASIQDTTPEMGHGQFTTLPLWHMGQEAITMPLRQRRLRSPRGTPSGQNDIKAGDGTFLSSCPHICLPAHLPLAVFNAVQRRMFVRL